MRFYSHAAILAIPATFAIADGGAAAGATPAHFVAAGAVLIAIATVIKGYEWAEHKVDAKVTAAISTAFEIHNAHDEARTARLHGEVQALREVVDGIARGAR